MGIKISALPTATLPLAGIEWAAVVQGGVTKKVAISNLLKYDLVSVADPATYVLAAGKWLMAILLLPSANANLKVGLTVGGEEIMAETAVLTADGLPISYMSFSATNPKTIYFTGLPVGSTVKFFIKTV